MDHSQNSDETSPFDIVRPEKWSMPVVFASPHSGRNYPESFIKASRLDRLGLRRSEDAFVDELFAAAPEFGAPLLSARFPRVYVDPNREPFELDPNMFADALPPDVNTASPRVAAGLGTLARVVTSGEEVYRDKIRFEDARNAIEANYIPYHKALKGLLGEAEKLFGCYLLIDCHSMPSIGGPMDRDPGFGRVDFILGDRYGTSCAGALTATVKRQLESTGYAVIENNPYAGGFTTEHYGEPEKGRHALQIEINRSLYMNEMTISREQGFDALRKGLNKLMDTISRIDPKTLAAG